MLIFTHFYKLQNLSINKGNNYFYLGTLLIQWGTLSGISNNTTRYQNFSVPFKDTNYAIVHQNRSSEHSNNVPIRTNVKETTRFGVYAYQVWAIDWIAIGF